jgi:formylmethanofuran dehydrogenase subunit C
MALELIYTAETNVPVEVEGLTPDALRGATLDKVRKFEVFHGNRPMPLGDLFHVKGDTADLEWHLHGDVSGVHWLGAHMAEGEIHIHGPAGRHVGSGMRGGTIVLDGDASDWLGAEMRGGMIRVVGDAGNLVGAAYPGSLRGMRGGAIFVHGNAGSEIGHSMRRGMIAVAGTCGDLPGYGMLAGSLLVFGASGERPGAGMRRGMLGLFGTPRPNLLPTFRYACRYRPAALQLIAKQLTASGFPIDREVLTADVDLFHGDLLEGGRGEILMPAQQTDR